MSFRLATDGHLFIDVPMLRAILIFLFATLASFAAEERRRSTTVAELFGSAENLEIVRQPEKVDVCVLRHIPPPHGKSKTGHGERYEETEFVPVPSKLAQTLQAALLAEATYGWDYVKPCWPIFHTRLRFHREGKIVAIDFCFSCDILVIQRDGQPVGGEDFKGRVFIESMRALFPDDAALKKVGDRR